MRLILDQNFPKRVASALIADRRIRYQQNLQHRRIALVVVSMNSRTILMQHLSLVQAAVDQARPGRIRGCRDTKTHPGPE